MSNENIMRLWNDGATGGVVRPKFVVVAKTSAYTITSADFFSVFTTRGAGASVTFTLPAASSANRGNLVLFISVANHDMLVAGATGGLVVFNDLTANSIGYQTGFEYIGGAFLAVSDGTSWVVHPIGTETQTVTVAT